MKSFFRSSSGSRKNSLVDKESKPSTGGGLAQTDQELEESRTVSPPKSVLADAERARLSSEWEEQKEQWGKERQRLQYELEQNKARWDKEKEALRTQLLQREEEESRTDFPPLDSEPEPSAQNGEKDALKLKASKHALAELARMRAELVSLRQLVKNQASESLGFLAYSKSEADVLLAQHALVVQRLEKYDAIKEQNRQLYNQIQDYRGHIRVFCRVRPHKPEIANEIAAIPVEDDMGLDQVEVLDKNKQWKSFTFDRVLGPNTTQTQMYGELAPLLRSVLDGYSVCIFAYGQTASGKTYTMSGPSDVPKTDSNKGIQYRVLDDLFQLAQDREDTEFTMSVQMVEVYNDQLRDLLKTSSQKGEPFRFEDGVVNSTSTKVNSTDDVVKVMALGEQNRAIGSTKLNVASSRSHQVVTIIVEGRDLMTGDGMRAKLQLVDLAGSERVGSSQATGLRLKEAQHINKSLSALGDVISALQNKNQHIPYRNSQLTKVLQDSIGGDAKIVMLLHVSPEVPSQQETLSTLNFGVRAAAVERAAPVKTSLSQPLNTSQMKHVIEDLAKKNQDLEENQQEVETLKSAAESAKLQLQSRVEEVNVLEGELSASKSEVAVLRKKLGQAAEEPIKTPASKLGRGSNEGHVEHTTGLSGPAPSPRIPKSPRPSPEVKSKVVTRHSLDPAASRRGWVSGAVGAVSGILSRGRTDNPKRSSLSGPYSTTAASKVSTTRPSFSTSKPARPMSAPPSSRNTPTRTKSTLSPTLPSIQDGRRSGAAMTNGANGSKSKPASRAGSALGSRVGSKSGSGASSPRPGWNSASNEKPPSRMTTPRSSSSTTARISTSSVERMGRPPGPAASSGLVGRKASATTSVERSFSSNRLAKKGETKVDARFVESNQSPMSPAVQRSASAGPVRAKVDYNSLLYSEEAAKKAEEAAAEKRKVVEEQERKAKLKKMARQESKIKGITDFDTLLLEAENQLARLASVNNKAQGEVSDTKSLESLEKVKAKIDAYEAEAQKSGALDSKNEAERTRLIKDMGKVIGGLQSDDVVSMDIDYRMEKQVQVKRCKQLIANLEMAAMTTSWSSGGW